MVGTTVEDIITILQNAGLNAYNGEYADRPERGCYVKAIPTMYERLGPIGMATLITEKILITIKGRSESEVDAMIDAIRNQFFNEWYVEVERKTPVLLKNGLYIVSIEATKKEWKV